MSEEEFMFHYFDWLQAMDRAVIQRRWRERRERLNRLWLQIDQGVVRPELPGIEGEASAPATFGACHVAPGFGNVAEGD